jgi:glutaredoxin
MAKEYLAEKGIAYQDFNVQENKEKAEAMIKMSGQMGVPVLDIEGKIIVGFDKEEINAALGLK